MFEYITPLELVCDNMLSHYSQPCSLALPGPGGGGDSNLLVPMCARFHPVPGGCALLRLTGTTSVLPSLLSSAGRSLPEMHVLRVSRP